MLKCFGRHFLRAGLRALKVERHSIIYEQVANEIRVVRVLHERMNGTRAV